MFEGGVRVEVSRDEALRLAEALRSLIGRPDLARLAVAVTEAVRAVLGCRGSSFVLAEGSQVYYLEESSPEQLWKGRRFPASACISGWAVESGRSAAVADVRTDSRIPQEAYRPTFIKSLIMAPMRRPGRRPLGAIGAYWAAPRQPTEREVFLIEALADAAAAAVEQTRRRPEVQRPRRSSGAGGSDADRELGRLVPVIAHDLRSPLGAIRTGLDVLAADPSGDKVGWVLERMQRSLGRADRLIRHLVRYAQVARTGAVPLHLAPTRLDALCDGVVEEVASIRAGRHIDVEVPAIEGMWDADRLSEALGNLLLNAAEHGAPDAAITLKARAFDETLELQVHNLGAPIPEHALPHLFGPFRRFGSEKVPGSVGLGLFIADQIVKAHGGRLAADSSLESGTTVTMFLPLAPPALLAQ